MKKFSQLSLAKKSGFTLIELLIVMVIIAVLATIGLVTYQNAIKNSRESKAISDMKAVQSAFEQNFTDDNGVWPASCDYTAVQGGQPTAPSGMTYEFSCSSTGYCACARNNDGTAVKGANSGSTNCTFTAGTKVRYCVQQKQ